MTGEETPEQRIRRLEQELLPDAMMAVLIERDAAFLAGREHGRIGTIDQAAALDPEHGATYRRGLSVGRAGAVDAHLIDLYGDPEELEGRYGADRLAAWRVIEYGESGAWVSETRGAVGVPHGDVAQLCQDAAADRALWWQPAWDGVRHVQVEMVTQDGATRVVVCAARELLRPIEPGVEPEWAVQLVAADDHTHPAPGPVQAASGDDSARSGPLPLGGRELAEQRYREWQANPIEVRGCSRCQHPWLAHWHTPEGTGCAAAGCGCDGYQADRFHHPRGDGETW